VRTNEDFNVELELEFDIVATVRPPCSDAIGRSAYVDAPGGTCLQDGEGIDSNHKRKRRRNRKEGVNHIDGELQGLNEMNIEHVQDLRPDYDLEDDLIEDEAVYTKDGILDIGELVTQLFRLKLDPFPKKPGTNPVWYSISG